MELEPGRYLIESVSNNRSQLNVKVEAGGIYYVWQEVKAGFKAVRAELQPVDEKQGQKGVSESRLLTSLMT